MLGPSQHTKAMLALHLKEIFHHSELTYSSFLGILNDNASFSYSKSEELQSNLDASGIE